MNNSIKQKKMKKYSKFSVPALALALTSLALSSCLDEDPVFTDNGSHSIVELVLPARTTSVPYASKTTTLEVVDEYPLVVEVNFTGVNGAPEDVVVEVAIDNSYLEVYDATKQTLALPTVSYELPSSNKLTIPKGQKKASYTIKLFPRTFDFTKSYALGIRIVSTTAGTISGNYSAGVYTLPVKSPWQGTYSVHYEWLIRGSVVPTADVEYDTDGIKLTTSGPGIVQANGVGDWYSGNTRYIHKPDGTIDVFVYSGSERAVQVFNSSYDLNALSFTVEYSFISPTNYRLIETYTRTGD
jgi:hypothetical protein